MPFVTPVAGVKQSAKVHGPLVFVFLNMGPYGRQDFQTLLLLQMAAESFQTFPGFGSQWSFGIFEILKIEILMFFFSFSLTWNPMEAKISKRYSSLKSV